MKRLKIEALAKSVPEMRVSNDDLAEFIETSDEWISQRTGIKNRRVSLFDNTSDLCAKAAKELLSKTSTEASEIDLIIVATMTPDSATPSTAAIVQGKIGAKMRLPSISQLLVQVLYMRWLRQHRCLIQSMPKKLW